MFSQIVAGGVSAVCTTPLGEDDGKLVAPGFCSTCLSPLLILICILMLQQTVTLGATAFLSSASPSSELFDLSVFLTSP